MKSKDFLKVLEENYEATKAKEFPEVMLENQKDFKGDSVMFAISQVQETYEDLILIYKSLSQSREVGGYSREQVEDICLHMLNYAADNRGNQDIDTGKEFDSYIASLPVPREVGGYSREQMLLAVDFGFSEKCHHGAIRGHEAEEFIDNLPVPLTDEVETMYSEKEIFIFLNKIQDEGLTTTPHTRSWVQDYKKEIQQHLQSTK